ncbi:MAG: hypothetical protein KGJ57_18130 [Sphingomonadales bacterium]|nr:hypothetical protein [Sphingomonadales bacterium]MDE2171317.1 hypothetical protein [Sphingomonadales bacterium]
MANILILSPADIKAIAASRGSGEPNLLTRSPKEVWADSAVGSAATIDIDLGSSRPIDTAYLGAVQTPLPSASWTITGGMNGYADQLIKAAGPLRAVDTASSMPARTCAFWTGPAVNARYLRISVTQPSGGQPLTIGNLLVGSAWRPQFNMEWGSGRRVVDTGTITSLPDGGFSTVEGARKRAFNWTLGDLADNEVDALEDLLMAHGESIPLLVASDPDTTVGQRARIHYGLFTGLKAFERANPLQTKWDFAFEEWL